MASILLVRHAETTLNAARIVQYPDTPLSPHGVWQAGRLADRLRREGVSHVASSDYARADATARAICNASGVELTTNPILRERHLGVLRGRPYSEVGGLVFSDSHDPEAGESWAEFTNRIDRLWAWVVELHARVSGPLAVVTHGLVCRGVAARHLTFPSGHDLPAFANASVTVVDAAPPWNVRLAASRSHLDGDDHRGPGDDISTI